MKTIKGGKALFLIACGLLLLLGCQNPLRPSRDRDVAGSEGQGTLLLSIGRPGARTILPDFAIGDFSLFRLEFENILDSNDRFYRTLPQQDLAGGTFELILPVGTWYLTVTALIYDWTLRTPFFRRRGAALSQSL